MYQSTITLNGTPSIHAAMYLIKSSANGVAKETPEWRSSCWVAAGGDMPKRARSKKRPTQNSAVETVAEAAGRTLGHAVNVVERVVGNIRPDSRPDRSSTPTRKRANATKKRR